MKTTLRCAVLGLLMVAAGCASSGRDRGLLQNDPDRTLHAEVSERLDAESAGIPSGLGISVQQGVVTVFGTVDGPSQRARALAVIRNTPGVVRVVDRMTN